MFYVAIGHDNFSSNLACCEIFFTPVFARIFFRAIAVSPLGEVPPATTSTMDVMHAGHTIFSSQYIRLPPLRPVNSRIGRTSMLPRRAGGIFEAT